MYPGTYAQTAPHRPAVIMASSGDVVTYAELNARSNRLAHALRAAGLRRGDHVAVLMENHPEFMTVAWAALRSGLYLTTVNSFLTAPEAAYIVGDCGAKALITSPAMAVITDEMTASGALDHLDLCLVAGTDLAEFPGGPIDDESAGTTMLYSSGTSGRPKGIVRPLPAHSPAEPEPRMVLIAERYGFSDDTVYLSPAPLYHAAPLTYVTTVQRFGGTVVVMEKFDPEHALALIERYRVTHSQWVPAMFVRMLKLPVEARHQHDLSTHRMAIHGAAPCPVPVKHQMIEWWGPILYEYYAGTESNGTTSITSAEWLERPGSVGRARIGAVHVVGDDGHDLPPGLEGTVYFSGAAEFEYHNDPVKTAEARLPGGRSTLGDVGYLDDDGYLYLTDRKTYMIISGGVNIYPREIEDVLVVHPKVADVAVFGVPDDDMGESVKAVVQAADGVVADDDLIAELLEHCRAHLAAYKCPRSIDFEAELPRLPTGKLYKRLLRDRY